MKAPIPRPNRRTHFDLTGELTDQQQRIVDELTAAGREGVLQAQLADVLDISPARVSVLVTKLRLYGLIFSEVEPSEGRGRTANRWRLVRYQPKPRPDLFTSWAAPRTGTLANPFGVVHAPRVVDAAQCRPWAMAAASRGGVAA